jgi:predicted PurR-regulated permease PerM
MTLSTLQRAFFILFLLLITVAFGWVVWPYAGAVFWGIVLAILFAPLYRRISKATHPKNSLAAMATVIVIVVMVIIPLSLIAASLLQQAAAVYDMVKSGQIDFAMQFQKVLQVLPGWMRTLLSNLGLTDLAGLQERLSAAAAQISQGVARYALNAGRVTFDFTVQIAVMLYLLFFLLRDGTSIATRVGAAIPLSRYYKQRLLTNFITVIRATVKGNVLVAIIQGALGGLIFWFLGIHAPLLWAVVMAFLSLLPAIGAAVVWLPVAVYLLLTEAIWEGVVLILFGVLVIGLVDNLLRPMLVGKDTRMPDYLVLLTTLGGMALFGLSGFVIGPVIAALFVATWDLFGNADEFREPE